MKPLRLKMYGIGPYATEVDIDFTKLNEDGLFLITGSTGAGKTSIFDGISYALYGETNFGDKEKTNGIICDYLDIKDHENVYAEFTFEVDSTEYIIKRMPAYQRYKKNGEKIKKKDDERLEINSNPSKKIPNKKNEIEKYIAKEILKVDASQFKKLIMLPQGAFNEFIRSNSDLKKKTLEKIFDTNIYKFITDKLEDKVDELTSGKDEIKNNVFAGLKTLNIDDERWDELLEKKTISFDELLKIMEDEKNKLKKEKEVIENEIKKIDINKIIGDLSKGESSNKSIEALKKAKESLEELNKDSKSIEDKKEKLNLFKLAKDIKAEYANKIKSTEDYNTKNDEHKKTIIEFEKYKGKNNSKIKSLGKLSEDLDLLKTRISILDILKNDVEKYNVLMKQILKNSEKLKELEEEEFPQKEDLEKQELLKQEKLKIERKKIEDDINKANKLNGEQEGCKSKKKILKDIVEKFENISKNEKKIFDKKCKLEKLIIEEKEKLKKYNEQSTLWFQNEAYNLVGQLEIGQPCPVCGSLEHPTKAEKPKDAPTKNELKKCEENHENVKTKKNELTWDIKNSEDSAIKLKEDLEKKLKEENLENNYDELIKVENKNLERIEEIEVELKNLSTSEDLIKLGKEEILNIEDLKKINKEKQTLKDRIIILERDLEHDKKERDSLKIKLEENNIIISTFDEDYKKIIEEKGVKELEKIEIENLKKDQENMESTIEEKVKNLKGLKITMNETGEDFKQKLKEKGFSSEKKYIEAEIIKGEEIEEEIKSHRERLTTVNTIIGEKKDYEGIGLIDLKKLEEEQKFAMKKIKELNNDFSKKEIEISQINEKKEDLKSTNKTLGEKNDVLNVYSKLSSISKGEYGDQRNKITFQNYVLGVYFEEVLDRANERFTKMTNNQYRMKIDISKKGNAKSGLDINVFDSHTGKERSIKTLSGGETFKASMALALGLSDVVQAQNGG
ncbi:MAG: hypothetical protein B6227_03205, partial [Fusobacteriia bacterium 4572_74]